VVSVERGDSPPPRRRLAGEWNIEQRVFLLISRRRFHARDLNDNAIALTYALPAGTPKEPRATLRRAFAAELKKARLDVDPVAGNESDQIILSSFKKNAAVLGKLKDNFAK
jgi:hypothetical protein